MVAPPKNFAIMNMCGEHIAEVILAADKTVVDLKAKVAGAGEKFPATAILSELTFLSFS